MSGSPERKWKTLRDLGSSQAESESVSIEVETDVAAEPVKESLDSKEDLPISSPPEKKGPQRVLVAYPATSTSRLLRETLESFTDCKVETTSDPVRAFELALQKSYRLFFFALEIGELGGPMLYELISKAYSTGHGPKRLAPAVIFIRESREVRVPDELSRDARVKDIISKPIRIDRLLKSVEGVLEVHDPTAGE